MVLRHETGWHLDYPTDGPDRVADATDVVEGLRQNKKILKRLNLDFGSRHNTEIEFFRPLPPIMDFTALTTLHVTQGELGYDFAWRRESLSDTLPKSIGKLFIDDFDMGSRHLVLDLAKRVSVGQYPNLKHVRLKGLHRHSMSGISFLASMQDDLEYGDGGDGFDSTNTDIQVDYIQPDGEGEDEENNEAVSGDSDTDSSFHDFLTSDEEWGEVIRLCLSDHVLMSSIARQVRDDSQMMLYSALDSVPLRKKVRALFSRANVKFECVGVVIKESVDGGVYAVW
ncbi:hypothetical protein INS49_004737, partial [Diaporthe citri]|uniref:uncharacterized protein n=1 Tax=Diaporthe citri TaxID=83186 RepID=UPI001C7F18F1